ncbi:MAG TPA: hypothetical protein DHV16_00075, partial [Nitrospiraceae bacterium]|nr:hypothetical protein [Nitrospiraceae bacterium]
SNLSGRARDKRRGQSHAIAPFFYLWDVRFELPKGVGQSLMPDYFRPYPDVIIAIDRTHNNRAK